MSNQNYYEVNVCYNGVHLFATSGRSATTETDVVRIMKHFKEKFPESQGYELRITYWCERGFNKTDYFIKNSN
jgi:hypothetical protein